MTSLWGRRIALTRPDAGELGEALVRLGAAVVHIPLIGIAEPTDGGAALRGVLARLDEFDWLVVTSANGARAVGDAAGRCPSVRLAAVGAATAAVLGGLAGREVDLVAATPRVEGLLAEFPPSPVGRVLVAQADRAAGTLVDGLAAMGHTVESVVAYVTEMRPPTTAEQARLRVADAVVFASGSAVDSWVRVLGTTAPAVVVVGPVTAAAAAAAGLTVAAVAPSPGPAGVVGALLRALP